MFYRYQYHIYHIYIAICIRVPTLASLPACLLRCDIWCLPAAQAQLRLIGVSSRMLALRLPNQFRITTAACIVCEVKLGAALACCTKQLHDILLIVASEQQLRSTGLRLESSKETDTCTSSDWLRRSTLSLLILDSYRGCALISSAAGEYRRRRSTQSNSWAMSRAALILRIQRVFYSPPRVFAVSLALLSSLETHPWRSASSAPSKQSRQLR